jgi:hypothetical protein
MMKPEIDSKISNYKEEYDKLFDSHRSALFPFVNSPQWSKPKDMIVKFSLFDETKRTIATTSTSAKI